jgi:hypothetical protein
MSVPFLELKVFHSDLKLELDNAFHRVLDSGWFVMGPELEAFEAEFAQYCEVEHCVGVGNGLEALHLLRRLITSRKGQFKWRTPSENPYTARGETRRTIESRYADVAFAMSNAMSST